MRTVEQQLSLLRMNLTAPYGRGERWRAETDKFLDELPCWIKTPAPQPVVAAPTGDVVGGLLRPVSEFFISPGEEDGRDQVCDIAEFFEEGIRLKSIGVVHEDFRRRCYGKKEILPRHSVCVKGYSLTRGVSNERSIVQAIGSESLCILPLWVVGRLISEQSRGEVGVLLINGFDNMFFVKDKNGNFGAIRLFYNIKTGWVIDIDDVDHPHIRQDMDQVFVP